MRVSAKGQITLPAKFRKIHHIHAGDQLNFNFKTGQISKMSTRKEWARALRNIPVEDTHMNRNGSYDSKEAPHFDRWMRNG